MDTTLDRNGGIGDKTKQAVDGREEEEEEGPMRRRAPPSLSEMVTARRKKREEEERPVFLTKEQRAAAALQRREEEVKEMRRRQEEERRRREELMRGKAEVIKDGGDEGGGRAERRRDDTRRGRGGRGDDDYRSGRRERGKEDEQAGGMKNEEDARRKELESIKALYLGGGTNEKKKRISRPGDRQRFKFEWDASEDTSRDFNPLYDARGQQDAQLLFGRGVRGGMDIYEQRQQRGTESRRGGGGGEEAKGKSMRRGEERGWRREEARGGEERPRRAIKYAKASPWSDKEVGEMTERDWRIFREDFNISYKSGGNIPHPLRSWKDAEALLPQELLMAVAKAGYEKPSPIQMASIPVGMSGKDCIGIAETGSGKTCAFVLPMLSYIQRQPPMTVEIEADGPYAIVMAPTRELVQQIEKETVKFAQFMNYRTVSIVGGQSIEEQGYKLRRGCEIVIATPGRMNDCLDQRYAVLNQCNYVVLDEADRMVDMGFEPQVNGVLESMPSTNLKPENEDEPLDSNKVYRTTYMFSATMPAAVERIARKHMRRPVIVLIGTEGKVAENVTQQVFVLKDNEKDSYLMRALEDIGENKVIVFVNSKGACDYVARMLDKKRFYVTTLHGGKAQDQRETAIEGFRSSRYNVLVATDVAGRGIDVPDVALVVNYDVPETIEAYTHRIGRTGRAGRKGVACSFLTMNNQKIFHDLKKMLVECKQAVPRELAKHEAAKAPDDRRQIR